ncbi:MAG: sialidase family protein [Chthoniobacterales bacterium]
MKSSRPASQPQRPLLSLLAALTGFVIVLAPWLVAREQARHSFPGFIFGEQPTATAPEPYCAVSKLNAQSAQQKAHSATIATLSDGTLAAAWYAGRAEGASDVTIQFSRRDTAGVWSEPRTIFDRAGVAESLRRHVVSLGNPVLLSGADGKLGLLFVSISAGKWSGSSINTSWSADGGTTWSAPEKLCLNPLANLSALPRNPPSRLVGGGWAVPIYEEFIGRYPEILWLQPWNGGYSAAVSRMRGGMIMFQPSIVPVSADSALAFYRDDSGSGRAALSRSFDSGRTWSQPEASLLPNFDSGVCGLRLPDGRLICALNDAKNRKRENLRLALSPDDGKSWQVIATLEEEPGAEFSYPYMIIGNNGRVQMVYSALGHEVRYAEFNVAWIDQQLARAGRGIGP